jgi:hypothetical protein
MAGSNWISDIQWDGDRPYRVFLKDGSGYKAGDRTYVSPHEVNDNSDPRLAQWANANKNPGGSLLKERGRWNPTEGKWDRPINWGNIGSMAVGGFLAAPAVAGAIGGMGGAGGGASAAASGAPAAAAAPTAVAPTVAAGGGKGMFGGLGLKGILSKVFGKGGLDPTMLAMMGLSAFGGDDEAPGQRQSFRNPGSNIDPVQSREQAMEALLRMGQGLSEKKGPRLRSSYVQPGPAPVQIKGLPFQIGGGLATDPAMMDPSLLQGRSPQENGVTEDPFQNLAATRRKPKPAGEGNF